MEWLRKQPQTVDVKTADGTVRGSLVHDREFQETVATFKGIPYAQPPVEDLRWRPPQPLKPWEGVKITRRYGPECPQLGMEFMGFFRAVVEKHAFSAVKTKAYIHGARLLRNRLAPYQSEDCLYLNVRTTSASIVKQGRQLRTPRSGSSLDARTDASSQDGFDDARKPEKLLPVLVYIHGGDYHDGAGGGRFFYAANSLPIKGRVVLVTFNYRLGLLGHFTHPELSAEAEQEGRPNVSGNYGILDQIAVLQWVQKNISAFGGDPDNVTIMGASAGGESVLYMMTSPLARGLFHRAIAQSPACTPNSLMHLRAPFACFRASEDNGVDFAHGIVGEGPGQVSRLRKTSLRRVMAAYYAAGTARPIQGQLFYPVVDGHIIPKPPVEAFSLGEQAAVPLLIGNNSDEGTLCYPVTYSRTCIRDGLYPSPVREAGREAYGEEGAAALAALYDPEWRKRGETGEAGTTADHDFFTDRVFGQKVHWLATYHRRLLGQPTYVYMFTATPPREGQTVGAFHGAEVPYAFGARPWLYGGPEDKRLASAMPDYWSAFAREGDPNRTVRPQVFWPSFDPQDGIGRRIVLGHAIEARAMDRLDKYEIIHTHVRKVMHDLRAVRKWMETRLLREMQAKQETAGSNRNIDECTDAKEHIKAADPQFSGERGSTSLPFEIRADSGDEAVGDMSHPSLDDPVSLGASMEAQTV